MADCPHGMPSPGSCIDCMDEGNISGPPLAWTRVPPSFVARYDAECPGCEDPIQGGSHQIVRYDLSGRRSVYVHAGCPPPPAR